MPVEPFRAVRPTLELPPEDPPLLPEEGREDFLFALTALAQKTTGNLHMSPAPAGAFDWDIAEARRRYPNHTITRRDTWFTVASTTQFRIPTNLLETNHEIIYNLPLTDIVTGFQLAAAGGIKHIELVKTTLYPNDIKQRETLSEQRGIYEQFGAALETLSHELPAPQQLSVAA